MKGFTLLETLIAMTIISLISVTSVYILFLSLNLRDLTMATIRTEEALRVLNRTMRQAVLNAEDISGSNNTLYTSSANECWSFLFDAGNKTIKYARVNQSGCTPPLNPTSSFFPGTIQVSSFSYIITPILTGGRQVKVAGTVQSILPFDTYQTDFSSTYINMIDHE